MNSHWGYMEENGPARWHEHFPQAKGARQSPVDINTAICKRVTPTDLPPLSWKYIPEHCKSLINSGYSWKVDVSQEGSELSGGPLGNDIYKLAQFHCHWGRCDSLGSEHTVDGTSYAGELHFVHWNTSKYKTFEDAACAPDGLAVTGVFLKAGAEKNDELDKITSLLKFIAHKGDRVTLPNGCDPGKLLPPCNEYWTYEGSLTTPPCSECVIWIVFKNPISASYEQLEAMRSLNCYDVKEECSFSEIDGKVRNNYRPPLPLGNRVLREVHQ